METYKRTKYVNPHRLAKKLKRLSKESKLNMKTVEQLLHYFTMLTKKTPGKMPRSQFHMEMQSRFSLNDEFMLDNLYRCFDQKNRGFLTNEEYIKGMGMFLSNDMEIKTHFCFEVYDLNGDGYITREEMLQWLRTSLTRQSQDDDSDEGVKELIDIILKKLDCVDHDMRVSLKDFRAAVAEDVLLLESLSSCLPPTEQKKAFLLMISGELKYCIRPSGAHAPDHLDPSITKRS